MYCAFTRKKNCGKLKTWHAVCYSSPKGRKPGLKANDRMVVMTTEMLAAAVAAFMTPPNDRAIIRGHEARKGCIMQSAPVHCGN